MKKFVCLFFVSCIFSLNVWSQNSIIKGKIIDVDTLMILLGNTSKVDTLFTNTGKFKFKRTLSHPEFFSIAFVKDKQSIAAIKEGNERKMRSLEDIVSRDFFLERGEVVINSNFSSFKDTKVVMAQHIAQDKFEAFQKRFRPLVKIARAVIDSSFGDGRTENEKKLCASFDKRINEVEDEVAEKFVLENTDNAVGAYIFYRYMQQASLKKLDSIYKLYNPALYATGYLQDMKTKIDAMYNLSIGKPVPFFSSVSANGQPFSLSDLKGKYVVLDFWGTWCTYCITDFPKMKEYYEKYKNKVEFISIACNDKESVWRNAVKKYNLPWVQILNSGQQDDLTKKFNILSFPTKILIDERSNLVQIFIGNSKGLYQKLDSILKEK